MRRVIGLSTLVLVAACGAPSAAHREPDVAPHLSRAIAPEIVAAPEPPASAACVVSEATGPAPDLLVASEIPPPPPPPPVRGRQVIRLDALDEWGPLHVFRIDAGGHATDLGLGSAPRMIGPTTFAYLELTEEPPSSTFVRVAADGTVTRSPGGNGPLPALGGPMSSRRSPFTPDGRFVVQADLECEDDCELAILDRYPIFDEVEPIDRIPIAGAGWRVDSLAISDDGERVAVCMRDAVLVFDRVTREARTVPIAGGCTAYAHDLGAVLLMPPDEHATGLRRVDLVTGQARDVATTVRGGAALDACATSAVVFGNVDEHTQRIERVFFDDRAPVTLFEGPTHPFWMVDIAVDPRGWVLVVGENENGNDRGTGAAWIVPLAGGATTMVPIDTGARVFEVTLGPQP